jgi:hypothetical protein
VRAWLFASGFVKNGSEMRIVHVVRPGSSRLSQDAEVGGEVQRPAGMPGQPLAHLRMLVGRIVVDDARFEE